MHLHQYFKPGVVRCYAPPDECSLGYDSIVQDESDLDLSDGHLNVGSSAAKLQAWCKRYVLPNHAVAFIISPEHPKKCLYARAFYL